MPQSRRPQSTLRWTFSFFRSYRKPAALLASLSLAEIALRAASPWPFKALIDQPGAMKVGPALNLGLVTVVVMSFLAWLPSPVTGAASLWAWLLILWGLITQAATLIVAGNDGAVFQWRVRDGAVDASSRAILAQHTGAVTALAVTDEYVVSAGRDLAVVRSKASAAPDAARSTSSM